jgi:WD40 repeat protein
MKFFLFSGCILLFLIFAMNLYADEKPEIFVQMGQEKIISGVISSDGRFALTGSEDATIKLWDIATGREIRNFELHDNEIPLIAKQITSLAITHNGKYLLSGSGSLSLSAEEIRVNTGIKINSFPLKMWDISTGQEIRTFKGHSETIKSISVTPDDRYVLSGGNDGMTKLWNISTGREIKTFKGHLLAITLDGKHLLLRSNKTLHLCEISTGKDIRKLVVNSDQVFSSDGRYAFVVIGEYRDILQVWDIFNEKVIRTFKGHNEIISAALAPDDKYLLTWDIDAVRLWDFATAKNMRIKIRRKDSCLVSFLKITPDGQYALSNGCGNVDYSLELWDILSGKSRTIFRGQAQKIISVAVTPNGKNMLVKSRNNIKLWDISVGKVDRTIKSDAIFVSHALAITPDGRAALYGTDLKTIEIYDISAGKVVRTLKDKGDISDSIAITPDGKYALSSFFKTLKLWNISDGNAISTLTEPYCEKRKDSKGCRDVAVLDVEITSDGRFALTGGDNAPILWEISTGKKIRSFDKDLTRGVTSHLTISPDGKYVLSTLSKYSEGGKLPDEFLELWNISTGESLKTFKTHQEPITSIVITPDGKYALSGSWDTTIKQWDIQTGKEVRTLKGHLGIIATLEIGPNSKFIFSGSQDGTTRLWDISTGKEIAKFISFTDNEWIVITPEGYYNSSLKGHEHLNIRMGMNVYGIDQFYDVFYRPDIVTAKLRGEDISSLITLTIDDAVKSPPPSVEFTSTPSDSDKSKVKVCYQVKSTGGGIGEVRLFHNGKLIQSDGYYREAVKSTNEKFQLASNNSKAIYEDFRSIKIKEKNNISPIIGKSKGEVFDECKEIEAIPEENEISVAAFNSNNTVQSYMKTISFNSTLKPEENHLYILSIGIDQYNDNNANLKFAGKDARDIQDKLLKAAATLYKSQNIHNDLLLNKDATKINILNKINALSEIVKPTDGFIMFTAGHGVLLQNQYFMLTHDFDGTVVDKNMISSNEIVEMSKKIKSLSQLFIFDTCHAGGVDYIVSGLYDARMSVLAKKMGLHIYASANSIQEAMDGYKGNGLFTYSLLDGLNSKKEADNNNDRNVSLVELGQYSKKTTSEISKTLGHSQTPLIINFGKDNPMYNLR